MTRSEDNGPSRIDIANLVISFVGVVAIVITALAGVAAWYGFSTFQALDERIKTEQAKLTKKRNEFSEMTARFNEWQNTAQLNIKKFQMKLIKLYITQKYKDFEDNFDQLRMDELHRSEFSYQNIQIISKELNNEEAFPKDLIDDDQKQLIEYANNLARSVFFYKNKKFLKITNIFPNYSGNNVHIHRILTAAFNKLHKKDSKNSKYLKHRIHHANRYQELVASGGQRHLIATNISINALMDSGNYEDFMKADQLLEEAINTYPKESVLRYNQGVLHWRWHKDANRAIDSLFQAQKLGDFSADQDIRFFCTDSDFEELRNSDDVDIRTRLSKLLGNDVDKACL